MAFGWARRVHDRSCGLCHRVYDSLEMGPDGHNVHEEGSAVLIRNGVVEEFNG